MKKRPPLAPLLLGAQSTIAAAPRLTCCELTLPSVTFIAGPTSVLEVAMRKPLDGLG